MDTTWNILRVVGQRERWVASELRRGLGLLTYVPIERNRITRRGKAIEVPRPLMPSYVFVGGVTDSVQADVSATRHVIRFLKLDDDTRLAAVSDWEIERIRLLERQYNQALHDRRTFRAGERVREPGGPFSSIEFLLLRVGSDEKVKLEGMMAGRRITRTTTVDHLERVA